MHDHNDVCVRTCLHVVFIIYTAVDLDIVRAPIVFS